MNFLEYCEDLLTWLNQDLILYPQPQNELLVIDRKFSELLRRYFIGEFGVLGIVLVILSATLMKYALKVFDIWVSSDIINLRYKGLRYIIKI